MRVMSSAYAKSGMCIPEDRTGTSAIAMVLSLPLPFTRSRSKAHKRPAPGGPSPAPSEPSDSSMADPDQIADLVLGLLTPRLVAIEKKADERHQQLLAEIASLKAENMRKDAKVEVLINEQTAMQRRLEQLEQASRSNNVILFNIPEERHGARPIDSVKRMFEKLPVQDISTELPMACMRIGKPRTGPGAKPRPIKATFSSGDARHTVLKRGKDIRAKGFGIDVDLTLAQQQERNLKHSRFTALKEQNMHPFWRGAKLFYRQGDQVREDLGPRPPTAPPSTSQPPRSRAAPPPPTQRPSSSAAPSFAAVAGARA